MESQLKELEQKIGQMVALIQQLRAENQTLRQQLAAKADDNKRLGEKIEAARTRLETLLQQIPDR